MHSHANNPQPFLFGEVRLTLQSYWDRFTNGNLALDNSKLSKNRDQLMVWHCYYLHPYHNFEAESNQQM